jgi:hydroxymethylglutaryl-CoA reductase
MKLHARNIAMFAGAATPEETEAVAEELAAARNFDVENAKKVLLRVRGKKA